ncbi:MAG: hypothetical protein RIT25_2298 [Planctomycetota bacterium]
MFLASIVSARTVAAVFASFVMLAGGSAVNANSSLLATSADLAALHAEPAFGSDFFGSAGLGIQDPPQSFEEVQESGPNEKEVNDPGTTFPGRSIIIISRGKRPVSQVLP